MYICSMAVKWIKMQKRRFVDVTRNKVFSMLFIAPHYQGWQNITLMYKCKVIVVQDNYELNNAWINILFVDCCCQCKKEYIAFASRMTRMQRIIAKENVWKWSFCTMGYITQIHLGVGKVGYKSEILWQQEDKNIPAK